MKVRRIEVLNRNCEQENQNLTKKINMFFNVNLVNIVKHQLFWSESFCDDFLDEDVVFFAENIFSDPITQIYQTKNSKKILGKTPDYIVEIQYKAGVTDNCGKVAEEALKLISKFARKNSVKIYTGEQYFIYGEVERNIIKRIANQFFGNELLQTVKVFTFGEFIKQDRFNNIKVPKVNIKINPQVKEIPLNISNSELLELSKKRCLALSLEELHYIKNYYINKPIQQERINKGLCIFPTDVELEIFAQSWSEHCKHKIFNSEINYEEDKNTLLKFDLKPIGNIKIKSLYKSYIKNLTKKLVDENKIDYLVSVFNDNAGIVRFDDKVDISIKVETHNSPSALDPYGGSLTGILGVNRDILGVGLSHKPIANLDIFCLGLPEAKQLPIGLKDPRLVLSGVHKGIEDGGNKSGIPTVNGSIIFDQDYSGKPLIYCGTIGVRSQELTKNNKKANPGDVIVVAGGAVGKDGIHGATFSSMELDETSPSSAVQIGDPLTQKRLSDFTFEASKYDLFSSITDNGAGGISSSVGEMAREAGGATIELSLVPLKYQGLSPYEIMISESQERMTYAVPSQKLSKFLNLAKQHGVNANDIGNFTDSKKLEVFYNHERIAYIDLDFLHNQLPPMKLNAKFKATQSSLRVYWNGEKSRCKSIETDKFNTISFHTDCIEKLLGNPNIQSKEYLVRQYDHEVQAATHMKPFLGVNGNGPSDAGIICLETHGGAKRSALAIANGLKPQISHIDTYEMAQNSLDEAIRNLVAVGGNPLKIALVDNFCWPDPIPSNKNPDAKYKLAQLVRCCKGLYDLALEYGLPLVSGKDSMKNDFIGKMDSNFYENNNDVKISVPPTLLITAISYIEDIKYTVSSDFKNPGDLVFCCGLNQKGMVGSTLQEYYSFSNDENLYQLPKVKSKINFDIYKKLNFAIKNSIISSSHDISDGGAIISIIESMIGGSLGCNLDLNLQKIDLNPIELLYNEAPGRFIITVKPKNKALLEKIFSKNNLLLMGYVTEKKELNLKIDKNLELNYSLKELNSFWGGLCEKTEFN